MLLKILADATPAYTLIENTGFAVLVLFLTAALFAVLIVLLSGVLAVDEDPRIGEVAALLSGANCGGCGSAGCGAFAKSLVEGKAQLSQCNATSKENKVQISNILGVSLGDTDLSYAAVACNGGTDAADKYAYHGYGDCISAELLAGGKKACRTACLGLGSCTDVCPTGAIRVGENGFAVVDKALCISCGLCIKACPKSIIKRIPEKARVKVACSSDCKGKEAMNVCAKSCIGCAKCEKTCAVGAITMNGNLPAIDYSKCVGCFACVSACPRSVIKKLA
jgi:electron transport complex protein RnfB